MTPRERSPFVQDLLANLEHKRTHLAIFRMWCQEKHPPECDAVLNEVIKNTQNMIDILVDALKREGEPIPESLPNVDMIAEARKQPNSEARMNYAERLLRRSLAWYEERIARAETEEQRKVWESLFEIEANNWALVEDYLSP